MPVDDDAIDDAFSDWEMKRHLAKVAEEEANVAWDRAHRMSQGKPVDLKPAKPKATLNALPSGTGLGPIVALMQRMKQS